MTENEILVVRAMVDKARALELVFRFEDAIAVYDKLVARFGESTELGLLQYVAIALNNKGGVLGSTGRAAEAVPVYEDVIARFGRSEEPALCVQVANALVNQGRALEQLAFSAEEIAVDATGVCNDLVGRFGESRDPALREVVARALLYRADCLLDIKRIEEAGLVVSEVVTDYFGDESVKSALSDYYAYLLGRLGLVTK